MAGYVGFLNRMRKSASWEVQIMCEVMSRDASSVTGRNILNMREEFNRDPREVTSREAFVPRGGSAFGGRLEIEHLREYDRGEARDEGGRRRHHAASELY